MTPLLLARAFAISWTARPHVLREKSVEYLAAPVLRLGSPLAITIQ